VAFNRAELVGWQAERLSRFFTDSFVYVVADNSSDLDSRDRIRATCAAANAHYVSLPPMPTSLTPPQSHGLALNWIHHNISKRSRACYIGYLDHDIFPMQPVGYADIIEQQGSYGRIQRRGAFCYYWPGLMFVSRKFFGRRANFLPRMLGPVGEASAVYGDTGAGSWRYSSRSRHPEPPRFFQEEYVKDLESEPVAAVEGEDALPESRLEVFDREWLHLVNGSNWAGVDMEAKMDRLRRHLEQDGPPFRKRPSGLGPSK
jgi:hypothetical protein